MTARTPDSIFRGVAKDSRVATKRRIAALESMARPSIRFLSAIAGDASNPDKLRMLAVELMQVRMQLRRAMKKLVPKKESGNDREQGNKDASDSAGQPSDGSGA